jgi:hypothetical protein
MQINDCPGSEPQCPGEAVFDVLGLERCLEQSICPQMDHANGKVIAFCAIFQG